MNRIQIILAFLTFVSGLLTPSMRAEVKSDNIGVKDGSIFIRKQITAGNVTKLIDGTTEKVVGLTNIDGNKLDTYRNFVIEGISVKYGTDAAETDPTKINYNATEPLALKNAELVIRQGGRIIVSLPVSTLLLGKNASPSEVGGDMYKLSVPELITEGKAFDINVEFSNGASLGANNHFVDVTLHGAETYYKS